MLTCARCKGRSASLLSVLGKDLCAFCVRAFHEWVDGAPMRAGWGQRAAQAGALIRKHGYVTSAMLAEATGLHRTQCNWYLHARTKEGAFVFEGNGRFVLPSLAKGAAE